MNETHVRLLGFDARGMTARALFPGVHEIHEALDKAYLEGECVELRELPLTLGERLRYFNVHYTPSRTDKGHIDGVIVLGQEVTEQVRDREATQSQNQALELAISGAPQEAVLSMLARSIEKHAGGGLLASILLLDGSGRLVQGAAPSLPQPFCQAIDGIAVAPFAGPCANHVEAKNGVIDIATDPLWSDFKDIALSHGLRFCWSTPILASRGKVLGALALYSASARQPLPEERRLVEMVTRTSALVIERQSEIRERLATESSLKRSEEQLSMAVGVSKVGFYHWDMRSGKLALSEHMKKDWGLDATHSVKTFDDVMNRLHPEDRDEARRLIECAIRERKPYQAEHRVLRPDGQAVWIELRGQVDCDILGNPARFYGTSVDIAERKQTEHELKLAKENAEAANLAKSSFLANMSHEIRTPLGAIMGFTDLLAQPNIPREELEDCVGVIKRNSKQLLRIIDDILDLSKVEAGKMVIENMDFSLPELLSDFSSLMGLRARENGIEFDLKALTPLPDVIRSDPTRLRQILMNVVGNAIKFTRRGRVDLQVSFTDNKTLEFKVIDTGRGISPEQAGRLFQPFTQADISTTRKFGGTGLGLILTKRLCEALGGDFRLVDSELRRGSVFVAHVQVEVPQSAKNVSVAEFSYSSGAPERQIEARPLQGMQVLVVEDSPDNQALVRILLSKAGAMVDIASDGQQGVEKALNGNYAALLMDVQMPRMDGYEATRALRDKGYAVPIIALTAHAMKEERDRALASGFDDFLSKPIQRDLMIGLLKSLHH